MHTHSFGVHSIPAPKPEVGAVPRPSQTILRRVLQVVLQPDLQQPLLHPQPSWATLHSAHMTCAEKECSADIVCISSQINSAAFTSHSL